MSEPVLLRACRLLQVVDNRGDALSPAFQGLFEFDQVHYFELIAFVESLKASRKDLSGHRSAFAVEQLISGNQEKLAEFSKLNRGYDPIRDTEFMGVGEI